MSRGRKGRKSKKSARRVTPPDVFHAPDVCGCPECSGADFDPRQLIDQLLDLAQGLVEAEDPLNVEIVGATFVSVSDANGEDFEDMLVKGFVPEFETRATPEALTMLLAIGSVVEGRAGATVRAAADRLIEVGLPPPGWAANLNEPVTLTECWRLTDTLATVSMLVCLFARTGRSHTVVISVNHLDCDAADDIQLFPGDQLAMALELIQADCRDGGIEITKEVLDPAELRWQIETALDARAVHDRDERGLGMTMKAPVDDQLFSYHALAVLLRARVNALPASDKPPAPHGPGDDRAGLAAVATLPARRKPSGAAAPVYQIKVDLRGAKPPIWRRLEVPADISLAHLHVVIQVAFDWHDSHLHVFATPYGEFGAANANLGHLAEAPVTLEQVAPGTRSKIRYTYDFGAAWEHDILVEQVLDRDETVSYPRCTGGRRAAPPEDCGGIWGYADLVEALADPAHPEHEDMLEWLGLDDATQFDPTGFDATAVTRALTHLP